MKRAAGPVETDIVLVGAGHAHVQAMRALAMHPPAGARITIVTDRLEAPYSGMLPGCIAGDYAPEDIHIDVARLARHTGCRLVMAEAIGIDRTAKRLLLRGRPPLAYDLLSLNVGITPDLSGIAGAEAHAVPVKPIAGFLRRLGEAEARLAALGRPARLAVVGGGPAGIELAFAFRDRWPEATLALVAGGGLAPGLNGGAWRRIRRALASRDIALIEDDPAAEAMPDALRLAGGRRLEADAIFVSTAAKPPAWLGDTGLAGQDGGIAVGPTLQALGDPSVFAAGDCATMAAEPRPRAGVFAVRQGPVLARNLAAAAEARSLEAYRPQRDFLTLLRTRRGRAIAARGRLLAAEGGWVWRWKDRIDRAFMERFAVPDTDPTEEGDDMRCGGCAAKVGPDPLAAALGRLPAPIAASAVRIGLDAPDDAAVIGWNEGPDLVQTVDQFRAFIDDPYLFGRIAANHALNDIVAMGGTPHHALALATLPHARPGKMAEDLFQLIAGARATLDAAGCALVGGHSGEGEALALGLAVTGRLEGEALAKRGARPGDALVLTKPLGAGIVFAADMRASAPAATVAAMLDSMLLSNAAAARILADHGARALTDISGFGLVGHLAEMLSPGLGATLSRDAIPLSAGVRALAGKGFSSSLLDENRALLRHIAPSPALDPAWTALLLDPQTAGGLLAALPAESAEPAQAALTAAGYASAAVIGAIGSGAGIRIG